VGACRHKGFAWGLWAVGAYGRVERRLATPYDFIEVTLRGTFSAPR
jgi:hypothetical protein